MRSPWHAVPLALLLSVGLYHGQLGMRTVIEDYIHKPLTKNVLLILSLFTCLAGRRDRRLLDPQGRLRRRGAL